MSAITDSEGNRVCWAVSLGNCAGGLSGEHLVSAALFPDTKAITVQGFPWCKEQPRTVGLASLVSNVLCAHHNNSLTALDQAAGHAFTIFDDIARDLSGRNRQRKFAVKRLKIDGPLLERWMLKTLVNLHTSGSTSGGPGLPPGLPEARVVDLVFGRTRFEGKSGLYLAAQVGKMVRTTPELGVAPLFHGAHIVGAYFEFRGFLLILWLYEDEMPLEPLQALPKWAGYTPSWHFKQIEFTWGGQLVTHQIQIMWPSP